MNLPFRTASRWWLFLGTTALLVLFLANPAWASGVEAGSLDKIPYVTGEMVVKLVGGKAGKTGTTVRDDDAPPGHPK